MISKRIHNDPKTTHNKISMATLTVKNIPDELYLLLKEAAKLHFRSMNGEVLHCIEATLCNNKITPDEQLAKFRQLRKITASHTLTEEELMNAKNAGRE